MPAIKSPRNGRRSGRSRCLPGADTFFGPGGVFGGKGYVWRARVIGGPVISEKVVNRRQRELQVERHFGFALLEDFIKSRTAELLSHVTSAHLSFAQLPEKLRDAAGGSLRGVEVGVWGLTFKANTDDLRDSPALGVASTLLAEGAEIRAYDPVSGERASDTLFTRTIARRD